MVYISLVNGKTHIYEKIKDGLSPRCDCSKKVKKSNTHEIDEEELKRYIKNDKVCSKCLRYKKGIIMN